MTARGLRCTRRSAASVVLAVVLYVGIGHAFQQAQMQDDGTMHGVGICLVVTALAGVLLRVAAPTRPWVAPASRPPRLTLARRPLHEGVSGSATSARLAGVAAALPELIFG